MHLLPLSIAVASDRMAIADLAQDRALTLLALRQAPFSRSLSRSQITTPDADQEDRQAFTP